MPAPPRRSPYAVLGVDPSADASAIRSVYRKRAAELHPDRNPGFRDQATAALAELNAAWAILSDPQQRARYDRDHTDEQPTSTPSGDPAPGDVPASPAMERDIAAGRDILLGLVELLAPARAPAAVVRQVLALCARTVRAWPFALEPREQHRERPPIEPRRRNRARHVGLAPES